MFRVVTSISCGHRRRHLAVHWGKDGWVLQWAHPTSHGYRLDPSIAGPFKTKREAREKKKEILG